MICYRCGKEVDKSVAVSFTWGYRYHEKTDTCNISVPLHSYCMPENVMELNFQKAFTFKEKEPEPEPVDPNCRYGFYDGNWIWWYNDETGVFGATRDKKYPPKEIMFNIIKKYSGLRLRIINAWRKAGRPGYWREYVVKRQA